MGPVEIGRFAPPALFVSASYARIAAAASARTSAKRLPGIVEATSDFYPRRLWGNPSEDLTSHPKYLVTFTVGYDQKRILIQLFPKDGFVYFVHNNIIKRPITS
ncbi:hypothetical protein G4B88_000952 [Cannabis sativa]|uniref:Uncharacterized protein n=1 Tax=Cannabis sativa TaxID=3483 RepID=A0A7J6EZ52_CANSA|nr:hypothetical protein G4B88_000952 [Cannabis sativa]